MEILPLYYVLSMVALLGLIIGSFLDVIVTRFHTGKSINGRSRCMSCGHTLSWYELFPLLSYVLLRGRCKNCSGHIPTRLLFMEVFTAALFVTVYLFATSFPFFIFSLILVSLLIVVSVYDIQHMVIPNEFVVTLLLCAAIFVGLEMYVTASMMGTVTHLISAFASSLFYALLWLVSKGKWIGLGDAKLAFPLGLMLTAQEAFSFVVLSFWIGAVVSLLIIVVQKILQRGKQSLPIFGVPLTMKSEVPFAPFMIAAFIIVFLGHIDVLSLMTHLF